MSTGNESQDIQKRFSSPFGISRYDEKLLNDDEGPAPRNLNSIRFKLENGKPVRLGDGSYGTVYLGRSDNSGRDVAIKLFYDNNAMRPRRLSELNDNELKWLIDLLSKEYSLDAERLKGFIVGHEGSDYALLKKLQSGYYTGIAKPPETLDFISFLDELTKMASSSAVFRFQSERKITGLLMDSYERRFGMRTAPPGIVEVIGGAEDFNKILALGLTAP